MTDLRNLDFVAAHTNIKGVTLPKGGLTSEFLEFQDGFFRKLEVHAIHRVAGKLRTPIPSVPVEKREEQKVAPVRASRAPRHRILPEEKIDRRTPGMIRQKARVAPPEPH